MKPVKILLAEDDKNLAFVIRDNLEQNNYMVVHCENGTMAWEEFNNQSFDLCIFDVMMPCMDGFTLTEMIRKKDVNIPVFFLSARSKKEDKINGFRIGADDYITKPFSIEELLMRIQVFIKRSRGNTGISDTITIGSYEFDYPNLTLKCKEKTITLTQKESDIIHLFCQHKGTVLKREEILKLIWGDDDYFMGRSLDVFISKIRKYLKDDPSIELQNIHGVGFKMVVK